MGRGKIYEEIACNREGTCGQGLAILEQGAGLADGVVGAQQLVGREQTAEGCEQPMGSAGYQCRAKTAGVEAPDFVELTPTAAIRGISSSA